MGFVITLDGPAGAGKSSVAKRLAKLLNFNYLDTGALYRAIAYRMDQKNIPPDEVAAGHMSSIRIRTGADGVFADGQDVTALIRSPEVDGIVSAYSALKPVRDALLGLQREQADYGDLVTDGRDMGTVVFPKADVKFFLTAAPEARAARRHKELSAKGEAVPYDEVLAQIRERDRLDAGREVAPLKEPADSVHVDTSDMTEDEVVERLAAIAEKALGLRAPRTIH